MMLIYECMKLPPYDYILFGIHAYVRKPSDESHKTLMFGVCGKEDVLKPLIILEKTIPLLDKNDAETLPSNVLFSKTKKGSMELKLLKPDWIKHSVLPHKEKVNPDGMSLLLVFINNKLEILAYPGHLIHVL